MTAPEMAQLGGAVTCPINPWKRNYCTGKVWVLVHASLPVGHAQRGALISTCCGQRLGRGEGRVVGEGHVDDGAATLPLWVCRVRGYGLSPCGQNGKKQPKESGLPLDTLFSAGTPNSTLCYSTCRPKGAYGTTGEAFVVSVTACPSLTPVSYTSPYRGGGGGVGLGWRPHAGAGPRVWASFPAPPRG